MKISLHAIFRFDMSQLNLNNFQTDRATGLCLDSKDAPFQAVSEFDFIGFRFYKCMLVFTGEVVVVFVPCGSRGTWPEDADFELPPLSDEDG